MSFQALRLLSGLRKPAVPQIAEHGGGEVHQLGGWLQLFQQRGEIAFQLLAPDRLTVMVAALLHAKVVGVFGGASGGPAGHELMSAAATCDEATKREILTEIGFCRYIGNGLHAALNGAEGLEAYQALMLALHQIEPPLGNADVTRVGWPGQHLANALGRKGAPALARPFGTALEKAHHFRLGLESARGIAFEPFLHDGSQRLIPDQHLAVARDTLEAVADRSWKAPVAALNTSPHAVLGLVGILLPLMLRDGSQQVLDQLRIRVLAELDRWRLKDAVGT